VTTPLDEMLDNLVVELHERKASPGNGALDWITERMYWITLVLQDTRRTLTSPSLKRRIEQLIDERDAARRVRERHGRALARAMADLDRMRPVCTWARNFRESILADDRPSASFAREELFKAIEEMDRQAAAEASDG
jgi:hypothetical protein